MAESRTPTNVLFLSAGRDARSRMAEGWARHLAEGPIEVRSAGIEVQFPDPLAVAVMAEAGIDIPDPTTPQVTPELLEWADLIITLDDEAAAHHAEHAPDTETRHWPLPDQARPTATGAGEDGRHHLPQLHARREELRHKVQALLHWLGELGGTGLNP